MLLAQVSLACLKHARRIDSLAPVGLSTSAPINIDHLGLSNFHSKCDQQSNAIMILLTTKGFSLVF
jgi:hypothetical protein